ncbi:MAG TPA: tetratricopeptide repeat protein [Dissulfurispiraceae bacterium]|nr:tetratricopeptide repeat protein [Dissulfurispiraceae bacterium]
MPKVIKKRSEKFDGSDESLQETVEDIRDRIKERQRTLVIGLAVVLVLIIAVGGFYMYNKSQSSKATGLQREAYMLFYSDNAAQPSVAGENYKKALDLFRKSYDVKKKADVLLYIAYCQDALGSYDDAIKTLKELNEKYTDPRIIPLAYYKMAEIYLKKNDSTNALAALNTLAGLKDGIFLDMALMESAKILESQGKTDDAKAKYKELIAKYPNSALVGEAKARLAE